MNITATIELDETIIATHTARIVKPDDVGSVVNKTIEIARASTHEPLWGMEVAVHMN